MSNSLIPLVLVFGALTIALLDTLRKTVEIRLGALQRQLNKISAHLNVSEDAPPDVMEQIRAGKKIAAIKAYREKTGAGLAEAKKAVENLAIEAGLHI